MAVKYRFPVEVVARWLERYGKKTENILAALRTPPRKFSIRVNLLKSVPEDVANFLEGNGYRIELHGDLNEVIFLRIEGPFELPEVKKTVVADKKAAESVLMGAHLFAPGVLQAKGVRKGDEVAVVDEYGQIVGVGIAMMDGVEMVKIGRGVAVKITRSLFRVPSLRGSEIFEKGLVYPQSFPAIVTGRVLEPEPGDFIVDMCAAPGGKASHIAQLMNNCGKILAVDRSKAKIRGLEENLARLGVKIVSTYVGDARELPIKFPSLKADKVLLDPPCSALGVRPKLYETRSMRDILALSAYQRSFLRAAVKILKKGGVLVYSTCTLSPEENELNVKYAVEGLGLELEEQKYFYGCKGEKFISQYDLVQRFYPDLNDTPGFFIARFRKTFD
ncbi:MAG: RsmB/NOP family class I SAM-dependent RNA methyltransferase [Candidatus Odinarchaeota archaeon]|nr:RsmB/NOP family class I SAM-dependent RNA methyltransferase [Candidatus Odinarchaeota archaeon]